MRESTNKIEHRKKTHTIEPPLSCHSNRNVKFRTLNEKAFGQPLKMVILCMREITMPLIFISSVATHAIVQLWLSHLFGFVEIFRFHLLPWFVTVLYFFFVASVWWENEACQTVRKCNKRGKIVRSVTKLRAVRFDEKENHVRNNLPCLFYTLLMLLPGKRAHEAHDISLGR